MICSGLFQLKRPNCIEATNGNCIPIYCSGKMKVSKSTFVILVLSIFMPAICVAEELPLGDQILHLCTPPPDPILDKAFLDAVGSTEGEEVTEFFDGAQSYLNCLEASKRDYIDTLRRTLQDYQSTD